MPERYTVHFITRLALNRYGSGVCWAGVELWQSYWSAWRQCSAHEGVNKHYRLNVWLNNASGDNPKREVGIGQYWVMVNLTKKEYINPHKLGGGLKMWEVIANHPSVGAGLCVLCAAQREMRGGGDLALREDNPAYNAIAARTIGRWAGDRVAMVGDYAEDTDLPKRFRAHTIYDRCYPPAYYVGRIADAQEAGNHAEVRRWKSIRPYTDVSDDVATVLEYELDGVFVGDGWRTWVRAEAYADPVKAGLTESLVAEIKAEKARRRATKK